MSQQLSHSVYFSLKDSSAENRAKLLAACNEYLTGHAGCTHCTVGTLAEQYERPVNDRDFDVAVVAIFESVAAHDAYQVSDRHKTFLAEQSDSWAKVRVFDVVG